MRTPKSTASTADRGPKPKGGRPKKTSGTSTTGNVVSEKKIIHPNTSRNYVVTSRGEVFRMLHDGRRQRVKPWYANGYPCVYIYGVSGTTNKYNRKKMYLHKLVYEHFGNKNATGKFIHHLDGNENNATIGNLKKVSLEENLNARKFFYRTKAGNVQRKRRGKKLAKPKPKPKPEVKPVPDPRE